MKTMQVTINEYEAGDIVDVSEVKPKYSGQKFDLAKAKRALVIQTIPLKGGGTSYKVVTDSVFVLKIMPDEMKDAKFIEHVDLSTLYNEGEEWLHTKTF